MSATERSIIKAAVRVAEDELHVECVFDNGEKFVVATIEEGFDDLAHGIADLLSDGRSPQEILESNQRYSEQVERILDRWESSVERYSGTLLRNFELEKELRQARNDAQYYRLVSAPFFRDGD